MADRTELDFNGQEMGGAGPLSYEVQRVSTLNRNGARPATRGAHIRVQLDDLCQGSTD